MGRRLTAAMLKRKINPGRYRADPTLYLMVHPSGTRNWVQRIMINGRQVDRGLGGWPVVTLEEARLIALDNRRRVRRGEDPFRKAADADAAPTFADAVTATRKANADRWAASSVKTFDSIARTVLPSFGNLPVGEITRAAVINLLERIINRGQLPQARKVRKFLRSVLEHAIARGWREDNPSNGGVDAALPQLRESAAGSGHHPAIPYTSAPSSIRRATTF